MSKDKVGNAGALGLCAFGLTTLVLMLHNNGLYGMNTMILAMGMFYGGVVQLIVGILEWNTAIPSVRLRSHRMALFGCHSASY